MYLGMQKQEVKKKKWTAKWQPITCNITYKQTVFNKPCNWLLEQQLIERLGFYNKNYALYL
jgi:hypothetical protein